MRFLESRCARNIIREYAGKREATIYYEYRTQSWKSYPGGYTRYQNAKDPTQAADTTSPQTADTARTGSRSESGS